MTLILITLQLWFDVGYKRYTTKDEAEAQYDGCGLMQDIKDIQPNTFDQSI